MKRFTETLKWRDPWYRRLSPTAKLLWGYLTDNCNCIGLIDLDLEAASFDIGAKVEERHLTELESRTQALGNGKIFIPKFIHFQNGKLSDSCPAHKPIFKLIEFHKIETTEIGYLYPIGRVAIPYREGKGKEKDKEGVQGEVSPTASVTASMSAKVAELFDCWNKLETVPKCLVVSDKRRRISEIRLREPFFLANWRSAMQRVRASQFCQGQSERGWKATFDWFIAPDSVVKIMEGKYDNTNGTQFKPHQPTLMDKEALRQLEEAKRL